MLLSRKNSLPLLAIIIFCFTSGGGVELYLDVTKAGARKVIIAIPEFEGEPGLQRRVTEIISNDLDFSGYFRTVGSESTFEKGKSVNSKSMPEWKALGAELLLLGKVGVSGKSLRVEARVYDLRDGKEIYGRAYTGDKEAFRKMAHLVSDKVVEVITGEKGIAQTRIAFVSDVSGHKEIYIMDYDGYNPTPVTRDRSLATVPSWLPDGKRIAYTTYREKNPDLYVRNILNSETIKLCTFQGLNYGSAWDASGKWYAVSLTKDGNAEIYLMSYDGREKRLTNHRGVDCSPAFSPDGGKIVFTSGRSGGPNIYAMDRSGKNLTMLTRQGYNDSPDWSPIGDKIVYSCRMGEHFDIWVMNPDGNGKTSLTGRSGDNENPSFSPDGRHIVFSSTRDERKNIYVMDADGGNVRRLTFMEGNCEYPAWSPQ